jgi:phage FluMu protein Com
VSGENVQTHRELPPDLNPEVEEFRCVNCGRFLGLVALVEGTIVVKCRRCKIWSVLDVHRQEVDNEDPSTLKSAKGRDRSQAGKGESPPGSVETGVIETGVRK